MTGETKMKLYKGNIIKEGTTAPYSLYNESIASFTTGDLYDHHDAEGFINLFGPVSYTHLDVYKRQIERLFQKRLKEKVF